MKRGSKGAISANPIAQKRHDRSKRAPTQAPHPISKTATHTRGGVRGAGD